MPVLPDINRFSWIYDYNQRNPTTVGQSEVHSIMASSQIKKRSAIIRGGLVGYYRRFIKNFSQKSAPLKKFQWNDQVEKNFRILQTALIEDVTLKLPNMTQEFTVTTDASNIAIGAVLEQPDQNKTLRPVAFLSKTLNSAEKATQCTKENCSHW